MMMCNISPPEHSQLICLYMYYEIAQPSACCGKHQKMLHVSTIDNIIPYWLVIPGPHTGSLFLDPILARYSWTPYWLVIPGPHTGSLFLDPILARYSWTPYWLIIPGPHTGSLFLDPILARYSWTPYWLVIPGPHTQ